MKGTALAILITSWVLYAGLGFMAGWQHHQDKTEGHVPRKEAIGWCVVEIIKGGGVQVQTQEDVDALAEWCETRLDKFQAWVDEQEAQNDG